MSQSDLKALSLKVAFVSATQVSDRSVSHVKSVGYFSLPVERSVSIRPKVVKQSKLSLNETNKRRNCEQQVNQSLDENSKRRSVITHPMHAGN